MKKKSKKNEFSFIFSTSGRATMGVSAGNDGTLAQLARKELRRGNRRAQDT